MVLMLITGNWATASVNTLAHLNDQRAFGILMRLRVAMGPLNYVRLLSGRSPVQLRPGTQN